MDRLERREILLATAATGVAMMCPGLPGAEPPAIPAWIRAYEPKALAEIALEEFDYALKNAKWEPPKNISDSTPVPHLLETVKMKRNFERGTHEDDDIIEIEGVKYKLDWTMCQFEFGETVSVPRLRADYLQPSFKKWRHRFAEQAGNDALIVTRLPTRDVQSRRSMIDVRSFTMVQFDLAIRSTVMATQTNRVILCFDSLTGVKA
jgi:hypothetical protein